jgi:UDP-N-acetylglucosamine--N-acetylmuramyl-(pentapeptide) pyrophosphoryl-undecaprenol N-acetylglucosamine transferase
VLVFGGSQGALHLDRAVVDAARRLDRDDLQLLVLAGTAHADATRSALGAARLPVRVLPYLDRMELAYAAADLVVARAGAATVTEIAVCGLPSILVPYPYATGRHQEANARALQRAGGASIVLDDELTGAVLAERVAELLDAPATLATMGERARSWSRPDAATALAAVVRSAGGGT